MPRGQDPRPVQGGQLNPYVQQSLQAGKAQAENRLLTTMREAGANQRAQMQEVGATQRTQMQIKAQQASEAAQREQDDKRAAEAEKARREEMTFRETMQNSQQLFDAKMQKADHDFETARETRDVERQNHALDVMRDTLKAKMAIDAQRQVASLGALNKIVKSQGRVAELEETWMTQQMEAGKRSSQAKAKYEKNAAKFEELAAGDSLLNRPVGGEVEGVKSLSVAEAGAGVREVVTDQGYIQSGSGPQVMDALQKYMAENGSKLKVDDLMPRNADKLTQMVAKNEISAEDIRSSVEALDGLAANLKMRADEAGKPLESGFWQRNYNMIRRIRLGVSSRIDNDMKIGDTQETVGSRIRSALAPIEGYDMGSQFNSIKEQLQDERKASQATLQSTLDPAALFKGLDSASIFPDGNATDEALDFVTGYNNAIMAAFGDQVPELSQEPVIRSAFPGDR